MNRRILKNQDKQRILELYRSYYTPKEISEIMGISYHTIIPYIRAFKTAKVERYDRETISKELSNVATTATTAN